MYIIPKGNAKVTSKPREFLLATEMEVGRGIRPRERSNRARLKWPRKMPRRMPSRCPRGRMISDFCKTINTSLKELSEDAVKSWRRGWPQGAAGIQRAQGRRVGCAGAWALHQLVQARSWLPCLVVQRWCTAHRPTRYKGNRLPCYQRYLA